MAKTALYIIIALGILFLTSVGGNIYLWTRLERSRMDIQNLREIPTALEQEIKLLRADRDSSEAVVETLLEKIAQSEAEVDKINKELSRSKTKRNETLSNARTMSADERLDDVAKRLSKVPKAP
jgi:uncharacterized coiled-coil DUF342 family protein